MLLGIDANVTPDLMDCLMRMGHGDELVVADANFPSTRHSANTAFGKMIPLPGYSAPQAIAMITRLLPLDQFSDACALRMEIDGGATALGDVHREAMEIIEKAMPEGARIGSIERKEFYERAEHAFGVVATTEMRPFGCFILRKGVIF